MRRTVNGPLIVLLAAASAAKAAAQGVAPAADPGALVRMEMASSVGVLLDEIPAGPLREQAAAEALAQPVSFWRDRASRQVRLTNYRLVFRQFFYSGSWSANPQGKGPLPLPPQDVWEISLAAPAARQSLAGHDVVSVRYSFRSHILTDTTSPGAVEPRLGALFGTWDEPFILPVDPELLLERTGYACMDEDEYPPGSVFEENTSYFYDDTCGGQNQGCHITVFPKESCSEALTRHVGPIRTSMRFTRVPWDADVAAQVRVGTITNPTGADLAVVTPAMEEERRFIYRFFTPGSCELDEGVISAPGWRRLLTFSAVARNDGTQPIHIGDVFDPANPWVLSRAFEFSPCHQHYHFSHYGTFGFAGAPGSKRAFCLEDTNRFHNDETTPLTAAHQTCAFQGIGAGWGDEYEFGIPGQWVDITGIDTASPHDLTFRLNPDQFLCEGTPVLDAAGNLIFDPSPFTDAQGNVVSRIRCAFPSGWDANNLGTVPASSPGGSFVTEPCTRGQTGPLRSCGFGLVPELFSALAGANVGLRCTTSGASQVLRVCERSAALGIGVPCTVAEASANVVVEAGSVASFRFDVPAVRDAAPGAGGYAIFRAPVLPSQAGAPVACTVW
ncbi:MAG TPA: lysyl oxidase family protein [Thermoanaerobaculia bacterium]|nr:lysyl oxidase family protein [Thermoanaerobaculia bacterium]